MFISILYMFRAPMCSSSGESYQYDIWYSSLYIGDRPVCKSGWNIQTCIPDGHLVYVTLCRWSSSMQVWMERPNMHTGRSHIEWHIPDVVLIQMASTWTNWPLLTGRQEEASINNVTLCLTCNNMIWTRILARVTGTCRWSSLSSNRTAKLHSGCRIALPSV
jgi:hypothetical protein